MTLRVASPARTKALAIRRAVPGGSLRASCAPLGAVMTTAQVDPPLGALDTFIRWSFDFRAAPARHGSGWSGRVPAGPVLPPKRIRRPPRTSRTRDSAGPGAGRLMSKCATDRLHSTTRGVGFALAVRITATSLCAVVG